MSELLPLVIVFLLLQALTLAVTGVTAYRMLARRAIDPLGHDARLGRVEERVGALERLNVEQARRAAENERAHRERLEAIADQQAKMLGQLSAIERIVDAEQKERREVTSRIDQVMAAVTNVGSRFGGVETSVAALAKMLDARPADA
jgi:hypothetical protein